jgi:asparagine synthase (glutamine-hydrolysing)
MCGICGWYRRDGLAVDPEVLRGQCDALAHRGPDDQGTHVDGDFGLGMRRLSILDLEGGRQPMTHPETGVTLVSNGEIVNFRRLRADLERAGRRFATTSDTEVVLHGFVEWGDAVWARLEGMFGIAVWDPRDRSLRLVRDPLGIKPVFYAVAGSQLAFASELKGLEPVPGLAFEPSATSIDAYFAFGHVLAPDTIYEDVYKLPPASLLTLTPSGPPRIEQYWSLRFRPGEHVTETEWVEQFRETFTSTVERHMVSDVPLGAFLSGGVDSSAVVAAMQRSSPEPVRTFTIGFDDRRLDESQWAARVAAHLGCEHTHQVVQLEDASRILPELARCYDEPFADSSAIPTWYLSRATREHVTVALSGDGGDEVFAGYGRHLSERRLQRYNRRPLRRASAVASHVPRLPSARWNALRDRVEKIRDDSLLPSTYQRFLSKDMLIAVSARESLYTRDFRGRLDGINTLERLEARFLPDPVSSDPVENMLYADTVVRLPNDMLTKVDRASMAHSLEVRVPFLSHVLVDWASTVPVDLKLRGRRGKWIVRRAIEPWLPEGILDRPKQGFSIPLSRWVRGDFGSYAEQVWRESGAIDAGVLEGPAVDRLFAEHRSGRADRSRTLYALAMFALWWANRPAPKPAD